MTSAHLRLAVGTRYVYDGEVVEVVALGAAGLGLGVIVKDRADRLRRIAVRELLFSDHARVITDGDGPASTDEQETAASALAMLDRSELQRLADHAGHVREMLTGFRSGTAELPLPGEPKPAYAPGIPMMTRYAAKAAELGMGVRTVQRWAHLYRTQGEAGLVGKRDIRRDAHPRHDHRFDDVMLEVMVESTNESKPSGMKVAADRRAG